MAELPELSLGVRQPLLASGATLWIGGWAEPAHRILDHRLAGEPCVPPSLWWALAHAAAPSGAWLEELSVHAAPALGEEGALAWQVQVDATEVTVHAGPPGDEALWPLCASARHRRAAPPEGGHAPSAPRRAPPPIPLGGLELGPTWASRTTARCRADGSVLVATAPASDGPGRLDWAAHVVGVLATERPGPWFMLGVDRSWRPGPLRGALRWRARVRRHEGVELVIDVDVFDAAGGLAARLEGLHLVASPALPARPRRAAPLQAPVVPRLPTVHPASGGQRRLWILQRLDTIPHTYHQLAELHLDGLLEPDRLRRAAEHVVARHDQLRAGFFEEAAGDLRQRILPWAEVPLTLHDLRDEPAEAYQALRVALSERPFDPARPPLLRLALVRRGQARSTLLIVDHHIVSDGHSMLGFVRALDALLADPAALDAPPELAPAFCAHSLAEARWLGSAGAEAERRWWARALHDLPRLELPVERDAPGEIGAGALEAFSLDAATARALEALARAVGCGLLEVMLAGYALFLARVCDQPDLAVGVVLSGRDDRPDLQDAFGFYAITLPVRVPIDERLSGRALLEQLCQRVAEARAHGRLPLEEIVRVAAAGQRRRVGETPLFRAGLVVQPNAWRLSSFAGLPVEVPNLSLTGSVPGTRKFELGLAFVRLSDGLSGTLNYAADRFEAATITRWCGHLQTLLQGLAAAPDRPVRELEMLTRVERGLRAERIDTARAWPGPQTLPGLVEAQVRRGPRAVALIFAGGDRWTYAQLARWADGLTGQLLDLGLERGDRVGVCLSRGLCMPAAWLGVMQAGGVYVALDAGFPDERLGFMLDDAGVEVLVTEARLAPRFPGRRALIVSAEVMPGPPSARRPRLRPEDPAYVVYTSGSSGRPKGALIPHRAVVNLVHAQLETMGSKPRRMLQWSSPSFDASVYETWHTLAAGGTLVLAPEGMLRSPAACSALMHREGVQSLAATPAFIGALPTLPSSLEWVTSGGDACPRALVDRLAPQVAMLNAYGPSECTSICTWHRCAADEAGPPSIGRPIPNTRIYILDAAGRPRPIGAPGELYIAGASVGLGYLDRPVLTEERFPLDPWADAPGARMYRTGDRALWRADGTLEFVGRIDEQLQVRGLRIEPGEIEAQLEALEGVGRAVVQARPGANGVQVVAWVATKARPEALRAQLEARLPSYMVPARILCLEELPRTSEGKVDRAALPSPTRIEGAAPQDALEARIAAIWAEVLGVDAPGRDVDFFALGGDSLLLLRLLDRLRREWGRTVTHSMLLAEPTVAGVADLVRAEALPTVEALVTIQEGPPDGPTLFLVVAGDGDLVSLRSLAHELGPTVTVRGCQPPEAAQEALADLIEIYAADIADATEGPILLAGYSNGGLVAVEVARALAARGRRPALLAILDAPSQVGRLEFVALEGARRLLRPILGRPPPIRSRFARGIWFALGDRGFLRQAALISGAPIAPYPGPIMLVVPRWSHQRLALLRRGWVRLAAGGLTVVQVPGDHENFIRAPRVRAVAAALRPHLRPPEEASS